MIDPLWLTLVLAATAGGCTVSAAAGLGGSLVLVPALVMIVGPREGIAMAALILAVNNVGKVVAYRESLPFRAALPIALVVSIGAAIGARLLVSFSDAVISGAVVLALVLTFAAERLGVGALESVGAPVLGFASGAASGFSGTSGPLKGIALRSLSLDRRHLVGAASLVSLSGDVAKSIVFADSSVLGRRELIAVAAAIPVMFVAVRTGRRINRAVDERHFAMLFWSVMCGYGLRVVIN